MSRRRCDLSLFIIPYRETDNWAALLHRAHSVLGSLGISYEILTADSRLDDRARDTIQQNQCILLSTPDRYGLILRAALRNAVGDFIVTVDSSPLDSLDFIRALWEARGAAEIVVGSRYVSGGQALMPGPRKELSRLLNAVFSRGLDLQLRDMSSAFRLYRRNIVENMELDSQDFEVLQEILVKARMLGYEIAEIPFVYRSSSPDYGRALQFGWVYVKTFLRLWKVRNSIASADYDARAYNALMPPQRYWQRQRYKIITRLLSRNGDKKCLDVGCGSSRIIGFLPADSIALDILLRKLRYARRFGRPGVQASLFHLPVPDESFPCVLCSQVIEHIPRPNALEELDRVLRPDGLLILGTPDYGNWEWHLIERLYKILLPQAYADEHITHYTYEQLVDEFVTRRGYTLEAVEYILRGELILGLRKPAEG